MKKIKNSLLNIFNSKKNSHAACNLGIEINNAGKKTLALGGRRKEHGGYKGGAA